jgi:hypothetical protein
VVRRLELRGTCERARFWLVIQIFIRIKIDRAEDMYRLSILSFERILVNGGEYSIDVELECCRVV